LSLGAGIAARIATHAADLRFELLIAVLELLDLAGRLTQHVFEPLDADDLIGHWLLAGGLLLHRRLRPVAEHAVEHGQRRAATVLRGSDGRKAKSRGERRCG
jgi:hypothetical protein